MNQLENAAYLDKICDMRILMLILWVALTSACATTRSAKCESTDVGRYRRLANRTLGRDLLPPQQNDSPDKEVPITLDDLVESCLVEDIDNSLEKFALSQKAEFRLLAIRNAERRAARGELKIKGFTAADVARYHQEGINLAGDNQGLKIEFDHAKASYLLAAGQGGQALALLKKARDDVRVQGDPYHMIIIRDALASAYGEAGQFSQRNVQRCEALYWAHHAYGMREVTALTQMESGWAQNPACLRGSKDTFAPKSRRSGDRERSAQLALLLHFIEDLASENRVVAIRRMLPRVRRFIDQSAPENLAHIGYYRTAEALARAGDAHEALRFLKDLPEFVDLNSTVEYDCYAGRIQLQAGQFKEALLNLKECERFENDAERITPFLKQDLGLAYLRQSDAQGSQLDIALKYFGAVQPQILALRENYDPAARAAFFNRTVHWSFWGEIQALWRKTPRPNADLVEQLLAKMESIRARQFRELRTGSAQQLPARLPLGEVRKRLGKQGVLLSYLLMDSELMIVAVTKQDEPLVTLINVGSLNNEIESLNLKLANTTTDEEEIAQGFRALSHKLILPAWPLLQGKNEILVIPDGKVGLLPFDLLTGGKSEKTLLDQGYDVRLLPSLTTFLEDEPVSGKAATVALLVGNLTYRNEGMLAHTKDEIKAIESLLKTESTKAEIKILQEFQATAPAVIAELDAATIHHFATHAYVTQSPLETLDKPDGDEPAILLSGNERLAASDIANRRQWLHADLTVLSACQTAVGPYQVGEGLLGLGRAFLIAGSKQVLVSLWSVSDGATAQLMKSVYEKYLSNKGMSLSTALRLAKTELRPKKQLPGEPRSTSGTLKPPHVQPLSHPYFWAGFVVMKVN